MPVEVKPLFRPDVLRPQLATFRLPERTASSREILSRWAELLYSPQADKLKELLVPFDPKLMKSYPVSRMLNKPDNDGPECAEEISLQETGTLDLWG